MQNVIRHYKAGPRAKFYRGLGHSDLEVMMSRPYRPGMMKRMEMNFLRSPSFTLSVRLALILHVVMVISWFFLGFVAQIGSFAALLIDPWEIFFFPHLLFLFNAPPTFGGIFVSLLITFPISFLYALAILRIYRTIFCRSRCSNNDERAN